MFYVHNYPYLCLFTFWTMIIYYSGNVNSFLISCIWNTPCSRPSRLQNQSAILMVKEWLSIFAVYSALRFYVWISRSFFDSSGLGKLYWDIFFCVVRRFWLSILNLIRNYGKKPKIREIFVLMLYTDNTALWNWAICLQFHFDRRRNKTTSSFSIYSITMEQWSLRNKRD